MKKILLFLCMVFITNTANARVEYYASAKFGLGDTTIYLDGDTNLGDWLVQESEHKLDLSNTTVIPETVSSKCDLRPLCFPKRQKQMTFEEYGFRIKQM